MASFWVACIFLIAGFFSAGGVPLKEDPIVTKAKQIVANVNRYLEENNLNQVRIPDFGNLTSDHILLTNMKVGNFSSMELIQGPIVEPHFQPEPEKANYVQVYIEISLNRFENQFDFKVKDTDYYYQGHISISPRVNSFLVEVSLGISEDKSCNVNFVKVNLNAYGDYEIDFHPDDLPKNNEIIEKILYFSSPSFESWFMKAIETISFAPSFNEKISNMVCEILVP